MMHNSNYKIITYLVSLILCCLPGLTLAADFMLSPAKIEASLSPGESTTETIFITNRLGYEASFEVSLRDIQGDNTGLLPSSLVDEQSPGRYSLKNYLTPQFNDFQLASGETFALPVKISLPSAVEPGGLYGAVIISSQPEGGQDALISNTGAIGALFFVKVEGQAQEKSALESFSIKNHSFFEQAPLDFIVSVRNQGNVHLNPYGALEVKNLLTRKTDILEVSPYFVLPSSLREIQIKWGDEAQWGLFRAVLSLNRGYQDIIDEKAMYFVILPLNLLIILAGLIIIVLLFLIIMKLVKPKRSGLVLIFIFFLTFSSLILYGKVLAEEMASSNYIIQSDSINIAGVLSTTSNYRLDDTIGEQATGVSDSSSGLYKLKAGYQQMQEVAIALSVPSDITMSPNIQSNGGTSNGSGVITVVTDSFSGYNLTVKSSASPAMASVSDSFTDYTSSVAGTPDFSWTISSSASEFGFSVEGSDIVQKFKDNGVNCNIGALDSSNTCWYGLSTSEELIASSSSANHSSGTSTTIKFRAESGTGHTQTADNYQAALTFTALSN